MSKEIMEVDSEFKSVLMINYAEPNAFELFSNKAPSIYANIFLSAKNESIILPGPIGNSFSDDNKTYLKVINNVIETNKRIADDEYYKSVASKKAKMSSKSSITDDQADHIKQQRINDDYDKKPMMIEHNKKKVLNGKTANPIATFKQPCIVDFFKK